MLNLAIDSNLRGCDIVGLRVEDVAPHGHVVDRATARQKKTSQPVRFEMTEQTREAVDSYIGAAGKKPGEFLFGGRRGRDQPITMRRHTRLVCQWIASIGLDPNFFGTHSLPPNQGDTHLPPHWQPPGCATFVRAQENCEHGALPRH
jgi:integrase